MIARVLEVIFFSKSSTDILLVIGQISQRTGLAPQWIITLTVLQKVIDVVITSSPSLIPKAFNDKNKAAVQEDYPEA